MRGTGLVVAATMVGVVAVRLVVGGWRPARPSLDASIRRLRRPPARTGLLPDAPPVERLGRWGLRFPAVARLVDTTTALRLVGRSSEAHVGWLVVAGLAGFALPSLLALLLVAAGVVDIGPVVPLGLGLLLAVALPVAVHADVLSTADERRSDLRHQLSAYLDMVTMLLAGNTGHEGALEQAAAAGDGMLFAELRRRMREVGATGRSMTSALTLVADDLDLGELGQVAATTSLSAAEGAPVARTLAAKCATLRSTLAADQEAAARVRNDKLTPPLVGMALLFMALIIYPALAL